MRKFISVFMAVLTVSTLLAVTAFAYPEHGDYIHDGALFLDEGTKAAVKEASEALYESKGIRIAICTVDSTGGETTSDYAAGVFTEWEPGNAVLILMVRDTNAYYAVQSNSITEYLSNEKILEILDAGLLSAFESGEGYSEGVLATVKSFSSYLSEKVTSPIAVSEKSGGLPTAVSVILKVVVVIALILVAGYVALIVLEKRQARKKREYLEERRRRMARDGRGAYRPAGQRPAGYGPRNANSPYAQRPGAPRDASGAPHRPQPPYGQSSYNVSRTAGGQKPAAPRRPEGQARARRNVDNAATVQINTADIRAAMRNNRR